MVNGFGGGVDIFVFGKGCYCAVGYTRRNHEICLTDKNSPGILTPWHSSAYPGFMAA